MKTYTQEVSSVPSRINAKKTILKHFIVKLLKNKDKKKLKAIERRGIKDTLLSNEQHED